MKLLYAYIALAVALAAVLSIVGDGALAATVTSSRPAIVATAARHKCHHHRHHCTHRHPCVQPGGPNIPA